MSMTNNARLTQYIKSEMQKRNLSQREAAERSKINHTTLTAIFGNKNVPTPFTLRALADGLGLDYEEILRRAGILQPMPRPDSEAEARLRQLARLYRELDERDQRAILAITDQLLQSSREREKREREKK